jgi:hypothetical protein
MRQLSHAVDIHRTAADGATRAAQTGIISREEGARLQHQGTQRLAAFERVVDVMLCQTLIGLAIAGFSRDIVDFITSDDDDACPSRRCGRMSTMVALSATTAALDTTVDVAITAFLDGGDGFVTLVADLADQYRELRSLGDSALGSSQRYYIGPTEAGVGEHRVLDCPTIASARQQCAKVLIPAVSSSLATCTGVLGTMLWISEAHGFTERWDDAQLNSVRSGPLDDLCNVVEKLGEWWAGLRGVLLWTANPDTLFDLSCQVVHGIVRPQVLAIMRDLHASILSGLRVTVAAVTDKVADATEELTEILAFDTTNPVVLAEFTHRVRECRPHAESIEHDLAIGKLASEAYHTLLAAHGRALAPRADPEAVRLAITEAEAGSNRLAVLLFSAEVVVQRGHQPAVANVLNGIKELEARMVPIARAVCSTGEVTLNSMGRDLSRHAGVAAVCKTALGQVRLKTDE